MAGIPASELPEDLLGLMLLYALHADSDLDPEAIYRRLSTNPELEKATMSVAEKLISKGMSQGMSVGYRIGRLQMLEEFLGKPVTPREVLELMDFEEIESRHAGLQREYETRFKR